MKIIDSELDKVLVGTSFSSKTKALKVYAHQGMINKRIQYIYLELSYVVNTVDILPMTLYLRNCEMNGGLPPGYGHTDYGFDWNKLYADKAAVSHVYKLIKPATLDKWRKAISVIDAANNRSNNG